MEIISIHDSEYIYFLKLGIAWAFPLLSSLLKDDVIKYTKGVLLSNILYVQIFFVR